MHEWVGRLATAARVRAHRRVPQHLGGGAHPQHHATDTKSAELHLINRPCNLIEEGFDCGVMVGRITDTSVTARRAAELNRILVGSPRLLKEKGQVSTPADLKQLPWMGLVQPHFYLRDQVTLLRGKEQSVVKLTSFS